MTAWRSVDEGSVASRRALVAGMEEVARTVHGLAATTGEVRVLACWQDAAYVEEHLLLLDDLARHARVVVACAGRPRVPEGVEHVELLDDDPLARELSLVVTSPHGGVALLGTELGATLPAPTIEEARAFRWQVTQRRGEVVAHARRLLRDLGARLAPEAAASMLAGLTEMAAGDPTDVLDGHELIIVTVSAVDEHRHVRVAQRPEHGGLATLATWLSDAGPRSPLLGLIVVRATADRAVPEVLRQYAMELGRAGDLVVDVPPDAAMLVLPNLSGDGLVRRSERVVDELRQALGTDDVVAVSAEVPAEDARRDLVGELGRLLIQLRTPQSVPVG